MRKARIDPDMPAGKLTRVNDFLPPPDRLAMPEETIKITISLSKASVDFFKQQASKHHMKYQKMIRNLVDTYTAHYLPR